MHVISFYVYIFTPSNPKETKKLKVQIFCPSGYASDIFAPLPAMSKNVGIPKDQKFNLYFLNKPILLYTTFTGLKTSWYQITQEMR